MPVDEIQPRALKALTALYQIRPSWEGSVILSLGLDISGSALAIAGNIVGAVTLAIDDDPAHLREVVRSGACDFVVNTLDEAIRAMKNEVRKRAPLSVALAADPAKAIAEILERGLAPQLFASSTAGSEGEKLVAQAAPNLALLGATLLSYAEAPVSTPHEWLYVSHLVADLTARNGWSLDTFTFDTPATLRAFDKDAINLLLNEDHLRRRWLEAAPRILQRQRPPQRTLWLTSAEAKLLARDNLSSL
jgi:urocanate hydratase